MRLLLLVVILFAIQSKAHADFTNQFYSYLGREHLVSFSAVFKTDKKKWTEISKFSPAQKTTFIQNEIKPTVSYIFGPLTYQLIGSPQKGGSVTVDWSGVKSVGEHTEVPYTYNGKWMIYHSIANKGVFDLSVAYNKKYLLTSNWKNCTDDMPKHQTESLYWYFWDPTRKDCEHELGVHYQQVKVDVGAATPMKEATFPEYNNLIRTDKSGQKILRLTFAFGYYELPQSPNPETDEDYGSKEYRTFRKWLREMIKDFSPVETPIMQAEYLGAPSPTSRAGTRFAFEKGDTKIIVNAVMATHLDQLLLFAKSFAHDNDGYFGWFGHSRVGQGFDVDTLKALFKKHPGYYRVFKDYQIVHWAGCVSYAYFTLPFFKLKTEINPKNDPEGTKGLDIIANGLKGLFTENAYSSYYVAKALIFSENKTSYQRLVYQIENPTYLPDFSRVLVGVLGDEDNPN